MVKKIILIAFSFLVILLLAQTGLSLGLGPGRYVLDYIPGDTHDLFFTVYGDPGKFIKLTATGPAEANITLSEPSFVIDETGQHTFSAKFTIPELKKPGMHEWYITVEEAAAETGATVGGTVSLSAQIRVRVPYPEKYAEIDLSIGDIKAGEQARFVVILFNYGVEIISKAEGNIEVFDSENTMVVEVPLSTITKIAPEQKAELVAVWDTTGAKLGEHRARANVNYDEKSVSDEADFKIGDILIEIINISVKEIQKGTITKVPIDIESKWSETITGVYGTLQVTKEGQTIVDTKTAPVDVKPWSRATLEAYLDATNLDVGTYDALVTIYYAGKTTESSTQVEVIAKKALIFNTEFLLILVLIVLILILGLAYRRKRKRTRYWYRW